MQKPTISVIVPFYNVEKYLNKCLESLITQTYKNLEIILVDDGSTDGSTKIAERFSLRDTRIKLVYQENGGVSAARNAGLEIASGQWIGWVDADDWIEPDMFEYLICGAVENNADIAVCSRYECYREHSVFKGWEQDIVLNTEGALELLLRNETMQNYLWDKLWKRSLFNGLQFPEGRTFEDIAVMHLLFMRAKRIACLHEGKYHYVQRPGSIVGDTSLTGRVNHYIAAMTRYEDMKESWPWLCPQLTGQCVAAAVNIWCCYLLNPKHERKQFQGQLTEIAKFSKLHYKNALREISLGPTGRLALRLTQYATWWAFVLARLCSRVYQFKHGRPL